MTRTLVNFSKLSLIWTDLLAALSGDGRNYQESSMLFVDEYQMALRIGHKVGELIKVATGFTI